MCLKPNHMPQARIRLAFLGIVLLGIALSLVLLPRTAAAQAGACPGGNLLAGKKPWRSDNVVRGNRMTDGRVTNEGALWNTHHATLLSYHNSFIAYDLGALTRMTALYLQADNNDTYQVQGSIDGQTFFGLWIAPAVPAGGLRTRHVRNLTASVRYLRIAEPNGDSAFSVTELQAYCQVPTPFPPALATDTVPTAENTNFWDDREIRMGIAKLVIGVLGTIAMLGLLWPRLQRNGERITTTATVIAAGFAAWMGQGWGACFAVAVAGVVWTGWLDRRRQRKDPKLRDVSERVALVVLILLGGYTWTNFGTYHGSRAVHIWDAFHYYAGSKYFTENRYELLYTCAAVAEAEDGYRSEVIGRQYRDLRTNRLTHGDAALKSAAECKQRFTPERWNAFRQDLRLFRALMGPGWFRDMFKDHGYNATPVWNMVGQTISNWGWKDAVPADKDAYLPELRKRISPAETAERWKRFTHERDALDAKLLYLALIDAGLYAGIFILIVWAFGLRAGALAAIFWAAGHPWAYYWTGGSFDRIDYLFMATAGVCLLKKGRPLLAGFALTWTALLRVFPAGLAGGVALKALIRLVRERRMERTHVRLLIGALLGGCVLVPLGAVASGGMHSYSEFLDNSLKHKATPLTNHMGLPTLMSYHPAHVGRHVRDSRSGDPFGRWKELRRQNLAERAAAYWGLILLIAVVLGVVATRLEDWQVTALSTVFLFALFELTCYYYNFMILLAPLALLRLRWTVALLGYALATQLVGLIIGWFDERYLLDSLLAGALYAFIMGDLVRDMWRERAAAGKRPAEAAA